MTGESVWPIAVEALQALGAHYGPAMDQAASEAGLTGGEWGGWLLAALTFEPEPVSTARLRVRAPYTAAEFYDERLAKAARLGFLAPVAQDEYRLTELGGRTAQLVIEAAYAQMSTLTPMPPADLDHLAGLLRRLVEASLAAPEPPGKWSLVLSRRTDPGDDAPVVVRIDQYLSDLAAYRDDVHPAAWQPYGVSGHAWEALTFLWHGEAATLDNLCKKLERRGHSRLVYSEALHDLIERGLVEEAAGTYRVTERGRALRQEAEEATDRYFFAPWVCLNEDEVEELRTLLMRLRRGLRQPNT
jgi:hypothetical protein